MTERPAKSWTSRLLAENPAFLLSALYVLASVIGLVYSWAFLRLFGINIFLFADVSDFFLASLKEPFTWVLAALAITAMMFDNAMSRRAQAAGPKPWLRWYGNETYRRINYPVAILMVVVFLLAFAARQEQRIRAGGGESITLALADGSPPVERTLLGTTARFVFVYDEQSQRVGIIPNESILLLGRAVPARDE